MSSHICHPREELDPTEQNKKKKKISHVLHLLEDELFVMVFVQNIEN